MNRLLGIVLAAFFFSSSVYPQTYYYRLTKKVINGTTSTSVSGGQFITFMADICYESDKKGIGVGHGTLTRNNNYSNSQFKVYIGKSYWGSDAAFKFTSDLATLNVVTESGDVYLYKRSTAPAKATTCSLIRKTSSGGGGGGGISYPVQPVYTTGGQTTTGGTYGGGTASGSTGSSGSKCRLCNGTGRKISLVHPGDATQTKWCSECNKTVGTGHFHTQCDLCRGTGWTK